MFVLAQAFLFFKREEGGMKIEVPGAKGKCRVPEIEGVWIQITFTLDPIHYKILWERAEDEHRTIPDFVRKSVLDVLKEMQRIKKLPCDGAI